MPQTRYLWQLLVLLLFLEGCTGENGEQPSGGVGDEVRAAIEDSVLRDGESVFINRIQQKMVGRDSDLLELRGMKVFVEPQPLSEADKLNNIESRASFAVSCDAYRRKNLQGEWAAWQDSETLLQGSASRLEGSWTLTMHHDDPIGGRLEVFIQAPESSPKDLDAADLTQQRIRHVGVALMSWLSDAYSAGAAGQMTMSTGNYNPVSIAEITALLTPEYIQELPLVDGWGHDLEYSVNTDDLMGEHLMMIRSPGRDGVFEGDTYRVGSFTTSQLDRDIVWADGYFIAWVEIRKKN